MPKYITKQYADSVVGCKEFIAYESVFKVTKETKFEADPAVEGVWRVSRLAALTKHKGTNAIILYMAGYRTPFKCLRTLNDFEEIEL